MIPFLIIELPQKATTGLVFIDILIFFALLLIIGRISFHLKKSHILLAYFLILCFCVFGFHNGDYYHYSTGVTQMATNSKYVNIDFWDEDIHLEKVYWYIGQLVNYDYFLWRLVVWGSTLLLIYLTTKRLDFNISTTLSFFIVVALLIISYARVSLAMAISFFGVSFLIRPKFSKFISYPIGLLIIFLSLSFHRSAIFLLIIFSLSTIILSKRNLLFVALLLPLITLIVNYYGFEYFINDTSGNVVNNKVREYSIRTNQNSTLGGSVYLIFNYIVFYMSYVLICKTIFKPKIHLPNTVQFFFNCVFWIISIATIIGLNVNYNTSVIFYRFLNFSVIPLSFILGYLIQYNNSKLLQCIFITALLKNIYQLLYICYAAYNGNLY